MSLNLLELDGAYHLTLKLAPFEILLLCFEKLYVFRIARPNPVEFFL